MAESPKSGELREGIITATEETVTNKALASTSLRLVPPGAVLVAMYGATVGRVAQLGIEATTNQAVCHIVPNPCRIDSRYLLYAMQNAVPHLLASRVGGAQPNISQGIIRRTRVLLPPLPEQRRIAAILDAADALRAKRRAALAKLDALAQSIFIEMFGDDVGLQAKPLADVLAELYRYPTYYDIKYENEGVPEIRGELISGDGKIDTRLGKLRYISSATAGRFPRTKVEEGDLVLSVRGTVGKMGIVPAELAGANITANLIRLAPNRRLMLPEFLFQSTRTRYFLAALGSASSSTTIATIKASDLRKISRSGPAD